MFLLQCYGVDDSEVIWLVFCGVLNMFMLDVVEVLGVCFYFGYVICDVDFDCQWLYLIDVSGVMCEYVFDCLIGVDGVGLVVCVVMNWCQLLGECVEVLGYVYKELEIFLVEVLFDFLVSMYGYFVFELYVFYIWLCGGYMCIVLFNLEGSFIVMLFLFGVGLYLSFVILFDVDSVECFFCIEFVDLLLLMLCFVYDFVVYLVFNFYMLYLDCWYLGECVVLLGDVVYVIVLFYGQGMNCGLEDVVEFVVLLVFDCSDDVFEIFQQ